MPMTNGQYVAPTWSNNGQPPLNATELQAMSDTLEIVPTLVRPNLLDNWYFVGGGSQQGGGQFPINQRGQTSYDATSTTTDNIDRWKAYQINTTVSADCLTLTNNGKTANGNMRQHLENSAQLRGKTLTCSALLDVTEADAEWAISWATATGTNTPLVRRSGATDGKTLISVTFTAPNTFDAISFYIFRSDITEMRVYAVKLELGDTQTLAHQENGEWVLNEIPNYQQELAKCQRYAIELNSFGEAYTSLGNGHAGDSSFAYITVPLPVTMRTKPTATLSGSWILEYGAGRNTVTGISYIRFMASGVALKVTSSGLSSGRYYSLESNNDASARLFLSADL